MSVFTKERLEGIDTSVSTAGVRLGGLDTSMNAADGRLDVLDDSVGVVESNLGTFKLVVGLNPTPGYVEGQLIISAAGAAAEAFIDISGQRYPITLEAGFTP